MPKIKTNKGANSRFRITKTGKILRGHQLSSHLKEKKAADRLRRHLEPTEVDKGIKKRLQRLMPYGQS